VEFPGRVDGEAKAALWRGTDIFVFPGIQPEGLPLVILEAMAAGVPVVATDTGAVRDAVEDGEGGLVVPMGDVAALAGAIRRLAEDGGERARLGAGGRRRYLERYTEERACAQLVAFFDGVG
jgi:glycosyltransferase involved in cell wall biosynthesis